MIIKHNENNIEIKKNGFSGKEVILYNGNQMSVKHSIGGSTHLFSIKENNEHVQYEVEINVRWHGASYSTTVRRNGQVIFTDK